MNLNFIWPVVKTLKKYLSNGKNADNIQAAIRGEASDLEPRLEEHIKFWTGIKHSINL